MNIVIMVRVNKTGRGGGSTEGSRLPAVKLIAMMTIASTHHHQSSHARGGHGWNFDRSRIPSAMTSGSSRPATVVAVPPHGLQRAPRRVADIRMSLRVGRDQPAPTAHPPARLAISTDQQQDNTSPPDSAATTAGPFQVGQWGMFLRSSWQKKKALHFQP